jgi:hypothetical protein
MSGVGADWPIRLVALRDLQEPQQAEGAEFECSREEARRLVSAGAAKLWDASNDELLRAQPAAGEESPDNAGG